MVRFKMTKVLHPPGVHRLKLVLVNRSKFGPLVAQCIFQGTGGFKACYTLSRLISKYGRWADSSHGFLNQLAGYDHNEDLVEEIQKYIGQEFLCRIPRQGNTNQMNISQFLDEPNHINDKDHVENVLITGDKQVMHV